MYREFPPIAFIAAALLLIPLPWHWRAGNLATMSVIVWLFTTNVIYGVDALIWGANVDVVFPVWCDITSKIIIGSNFALPAACLCICVHLEQVASIRQARVSMLDKRRRQIYEGLACFGLPVLFMGLHYIVQGHRFDIIEGYGCRPTTYVSIPAIFIVWIPPLLMGLATLVFAGLALRHFIHRRLSFAIHLASNSALTTSRYLRLVAMAAVQMIWSITLTSYTLWFSTNNVPLRPWISWDFVHSDFSRVDIYPAAFTPKVVATTYYILWWMLPASTFIFVAFFAFGQDAVEEYKAGFTWFKKRVLRMSVVNESKGSFGSFSFIKSSSGGDFVSTSVAKMSNGPISPTSSSLPPYEFSASLGSIKSSNPPASFDYGFQSLASEATSIDRIGSEDVDSLPATPSTLHSLTPPPCLRGTNSRHAYISPFSSRPITYPSLEASRQAIDHDHT